MSDFRHKLEATNDFVVGVELVSTRGTVQETLASRTVAFARDLAASPQVDWVSITDNAGGNPMLAPPTLGGIIRDGGRDVVIHLSCKDLNRNGLESEAWMLASEGFHNLLALTGDYSGPGVDGTAKPVFDIDSVGLLALLARMNAGLELARPRSGGTTRLAPTRFYPGCVVTNFKLHENEVVPQLLKLDKKIANGARWVINQIGFDSRKTSELVAWLRRPGAVSAGMPLIGNVYLLSPRVARLFRTGRIPGVVVSDALADVCERQAASPDRGRAFFVELAAKQIAIHRGLGCRGVYLGGVHTMAEVDEVLALSRTFAPDDWKAFAREVRFSRPGECFLFAEDPATGLADAASWDSGYTQSLRRPPPSPHVDLHYRVSKWTHDAMFTPGRGLWNLGARLAAGARDPMQGPAWLRAIEHAGKSLMFRCKDCGDCSLPDIAFLCPESACAKNQRNGPCGGTRDGLCEVDDFPCIWARAYDRLKSDHRSEELLDHAPVLQDQSLRGTSSWANTWLGRDHLARSRATAASSSDSIPTDPTP
ncbi:methylenetetrahydrofolate reductase C-terminal domain-containing protein [Opitutales bacterium ASA1]|uniref:methylenetetrahydrofolate reductase C-terminal domain-containing protein n=1 Tax=Congregicoccus parvus TaxID=3081749 RepID=UPI002B2C5463|nr:methylenetetrahydrofolate reductase C-terminal domain-containing protein [Opitutales bacterium ASA1]